MLRIRDPVLILISGLDILILDPGSGSYFQELTNNFWVKILNSLLRIQDPGPFYPGSGIREDPGWNNSDLGSGINILDPQHGKYRVVFLKKLRRRPKDKERAVHFVQYSTGQDRSDLYLFFQVAGSCLTLTSPLLSVVNLSLLSSHLFLVAAITLATSE